LSPSPVPIDVEGQTEEILSRTVIGPHLEAHGWNVSWSVLESRRLASGAKFRGWRLGKRCDQAIGKRAVRKLLHDKRSERSIHGVHFGHFRVQWDSKVQVRRFPLWGPQNFEV
jgi:hypothetical protein